MGWSSFELPALGARIALVVGRRVAASIDEINTALLELEGVHDAHERWSLGLRWIGLRPKFRGDFNFLAGREEFAFCESAGVGALALGGE